jgi:Prokaryotic E2 family E
VLTNADEAFLAAKGWAYEVIADGQIFTLIIHGYKLPAGYDHDEVDLLLRLPAGFPDAAPDMFWMAPFVAYADGSIPPQTELRQDFHGRTWQRWSRHLAIAWRPGIDSLQSYLRLIRTDLEAGGLRTAA